MEANPMKKAISLASNLIQRIQYELAVFAFLLLKGLPMADFSSLDGWQSMSYVLSYKYGFCSRFLIGTLFRLIHPDYVTAKDTAIFVNLAVIFDCLLISLIIGTLLRSAQKRGQLALAAIPVVIYLAVPLNISIYFSSGGHAGKLEIFLLPLMLLSAWLLLRTAPDIKQTVLLSCITVIALLIYQNYIFLCFPLILALLIYNLFEYGWTRKNIFFSLSVCAVTGVAFLYLQLFANVNAADAAALTSELQSQTNMEIVGDAVFYEYFASFSEFFDDLMLYRFGYQFSVLLLDLILLSPAIFVYIYIWVKAFKSCNTGNEKWLLAGMQLCSAAFLPTYIITCDWARWSIWFIMFQAALVLLLWYRGFAPIVNALSHTLELIKKYKALSALVIVYFLSLTILSVTEMFVISKTLYHIIFNR